MSAATINQIITTEGMHPPRPPTSAIHKFYQQLIKFALNLIYDTLKTKQPIAPGGLGLTDALLQIFTIGFSPSLRIT